MTAAVGPPGGVGGLAGLWCGGGGTQPFPRTLKMRKAIPAARNRYFFIRFTGKNAIPMPGEKKPRLFGVSQRSRPLEIEILPRVIVTDVANNLADPFHIVGQLPVRH